MTSLRRAVPGPLAGSALRALSARVLGWGICALLVACQQGNDMAATNQARLPGNQDAIALAPLAEPERTGVWLGGPEPVSGKLRTGIALYVRPFSPVLGQPFDLVLRFEGVSGDDASVRLSTSDGARLMQQGGESTWRLTAGAASQLVVKLMTPPGDSYLHVFTAQHGRHAARSIALTLPSDAPQRPAGYRGGDAKDASGEPIVRMQAGPQK